MKYLCTHISVGTLVSPRTGEGDELMAPLVNHETANWSEKGNQQLEQQSSSQRK